MLPAPAQGIYAEVLTPIEMAFRGGIWEVIRLDKVMRMGSVPFQERILESCLSVHLSLCLSVSVSVLKAAAPEADCLTV